MRNNQRAYVDGRKQHRERCVSLVQKITCERQGGEQKHRHSTQSGVRDREESRNIGTARSLV